MENGAQALLMAAAVLIFVIALSVTFSTLSQAKSIADVVLFYSDREIFQEHITPDIGTYQDGGRTVDGHTVIATLKRFGHENFAIKIIDKNNHTFHDDDYNELDLDPATFQINSLGDSQKEIKERINKFINDCYSDLINSSFRETFVEITVNGETHAGEGGLTLEENVQKKLFIKYKQL